MKKKILSVLSVLSVIMLVFLTGCGKSKEEKQTVPETTTAIPEAVTGDKTASKTTIGKGNTSFFYEVTYPDGTLKSYLVKTDEKTVGDALYNYGLIQGTKDANGIFVKTIDAVTADYEKDKAYWAFFVDGKLSAKGASKVECKNDAIYSFVYTVEK